MTDMTGVGDAKKSAKTKVYVVLSGHDEDMFVAGVSSTKEKADKVIDDWGIIGGRAEEYELDALSELDPNHHVFVILMRRDGSIVWLRDVVHDIDYAGRHETKFFGPHPGSTYFSAEIPTDTSAQAVAIADEYRLKAIAEGKWEDITNLFEPEYKLIHPKGKEDQDEGQGVD